MSEHSDRLLARVGIAALSLRDDDAEDLAARGVRGARAANQLVFRLLIIAAVLVAFMTLYGLTQ